LIALLVKDLSQGQFSVIEVIRPVVPDQMSDGITAGKKRAMRRQGQRHGRVAIPEYDTIMPERVYVGSLGLCVAVNSDTVCSCRVQSYDKKVGISCLSFPRGREKKTSQEREEKEQHEFLLHSFLV
jgi:hypothetical protein